MANMKRANDRLIQRHATLPSHPSRGVLWTLILPPDQRPFSFSAALKAVESRLRVLEGVASSA